MSRPRLVRVCKCVTVCVCVCVVRGKEDGGEGKEKKKEKRKKKYKTRISADKMRVVPENNVNPGKLQHIMNTCKPFSYEICGGGEREDFRNHRPNDLSFDRSHRGTHIIIITTARARRRTNRMHKRRRRFVLQVRSFVAVADDINA